MAIDVIDADNHVVIEKPIGLTKANVKMLFLKPYKRQTSICSDAK